MSNNYDTIPLPNCRVKTYPDGSQEILICSRGIFNPEKIECDSDDLSFNDTFCPLNDDECCAAIPCSLSERSIRRARQKIKDYILCNSFSHFITFTLDGALIDRTDYTKIIKPLSKWLDNRVQRKGLKYLLIAEYHKDKQSIHFHGLTNDTLKFVDSGTVSVKGVKKPVLLSTYKKLYAGRECHTVYNISDWKYGFSTAIKLYGDRGAVANYVGKYMQKDVQKIGGRLYLHSSNLLLPYVQYCCEPFDLFDGQAFNFNDVNTWWKYKKI